MITPVMSRRLLSIHVDEPWGLVGQPDRLIVEYLNHIPFQDIDYSIFEQYNGFFGSVS